MTRRLAFASLSLLPLLAACGNTLYQPGRGVRFDPADQVSDDEIRDAFGARPQLHGPMRVAYFAFDDRHAADLERSLSGLPNVEAIYRIPELLVLGKRRFEPSAPAEQQPLSIRQLRLQAARAHCQLLVVVDYGYKVDRSANGWAVLNVLVLPSLFVPFLDSEVESYMDSYVIDVRNGYLYGQLNAREEGEKKRLTIWSDDDDDLVEAQWWVLLTATHDTLKKLVTGPGASDPVRAAAVGG
ncbi:MAG TPA: hypothetical protein VIG06_22960 [Kofleriaceae bacterium]|jgi:hypothetical protein